MRLVTFASDFGVLAGVLEGDRILPLAGLDVLSIIEMGPAGLERARALAAEAAGHALPYDPAMLLAPIPNPRRNIFCLGKNYAEHAIEMQRAGNQPAKLPEVPIFFTKATTTVNGPFADIPFFPQVSTRIDWEVELAVVIGKAGINIPCAQAMEHVFGYTVINDISARDLQSRHQQYFKGKSLDGSCPMGPAIVTADEVPDPHALGLRCRVNGVLKQESTTGKMIFDIPACIESLSRGMTLLPGDVIATGTPSGVGNARTPPEYLEPGDVVESEVDGVGLIRNTIRAVE